MRVIVVSNRCARHLQHRGPVLDVFREPRAGVRVIETKSLEELDRAAAEIAREVPDAVVLAGGDGSYTAGLTALARTLGEKALSELPIALAPGGTACTVPRDWDWRSGDATLHARRVMRALDDPRTRRRPTLRVRDGDASAPRIGFIFGAGLVARFFEVYEREGANGERGAAKIVARIFAGSFVGGRTAKHVLTPEPCAIEVEGVTAPFDRASLVAASVVKDLGLHIRLLYRAAERTDRFHFVATPAAPRELGPQLLRVLAARPLRDPKIDTMTAHATLRFPQGRGAYVLDGELLRSDVVRVEAGPVLRFVDVGDVGA
jgi:diacylglycerol kinase family enzyme